MIHTRESLKRLALRTGATVEIDGEPFNASRSKAPYIAPAPAPAATEAPKPIERMPEIAQLMASVAAAVENSNSASSDRIVRALENLKMPQPAPGKPLKWVWKVVRDKDGNMDFIEAEAK